jgi:hypothetical protein
MLQIDVADWKECPGGKIQRYGFYLIRPEVWDNKLGKETFDTQGVKVLSHI